MEIESRGVWPFLAPFQVGVVRTGMGGLRQIARYRIADMRDNAICFCYDRENADIIVRALNHYAKR